MEQGEEEMDEGPYSSEPEFKQVKIYCTKVYIMTCYNSQSLLTSLSAIAVEKVTVVRKLIYAVGTLPYAFTLNVIGFYFTVFLLDVASVRNRINK